MLPKESINNNVTIFFDEATSARIYKKDNTFEIKDNPIARAGILEYKGESIMAGKGRELFPWIDPNKMYKVFRSPEELSSEKTLKSFELIPIIDGHEYIGIGINGVIAPEEKGVHGTTGQEVYYDTKDDMLKINLKFFSESMSQSIDNGKNQLSIGCTCLYESSPGVYNGESYDFLQRNLQANHLAIVFEGRSGPEVAVLDQAENVNTEIKGDNMADVENKIQDEGESSEAKIYSIQDCMDAIAGLGERLDALMGERKEAMAADEDPEMESEAEDADEDSEKDKEEKKDEDEAKAMDEKEFLVRDHARRSLAEKLVKHVGNFDYATKTLSEIASYGVKKLNLACKKGSEAVMLEGFLAGAKTSSPVAYAMDKSDKQKPSSAVVINSTLEAYKKGEI
jgi:hypothetical protein